MRELWPAVLILGSLACERASPPRPAASSSAVAPKPNVCASGGGTLDDAERAAWFPRRGEGFCIDPHADFRSFGERAKAPLALACEVLPGDCARYARFGLRHVVIVPYVIADDPRSRVTVTLLELSTLDSAYAFFTDELLGDGPDDFKAWKPIDNTRSVFRSGAKAIVWHTTRVALLDYADETSTPGGAAARGAHVLEMLARWVNGGLPDTAKLPLSAALLPRRDGGPVGERYEHLDLFDIGGLGPGALARYAPGGRSAPLALLARADDDAAKDVLRTLQRVPGSQKLRGAPYEALRVPLRPAEAAPLVEWLFGRKRHVVLGIGREREKLERSAEDRVRHAELLRLKALLDDLESPAPDGGMR